MDEGHGVDHLHSAGGGHGLLNGAAHKLACCQAQRGPHALAACGAKWQQRGQEWLWQWVRREGDLGA